MLPSPISLTLETAHTHTPDTDDIPFIVSNGALDMPIMLGSCARSHSLMYFCSYLKAHVMLFRYQGLWVQSIYSPKVHVLKVLLALCQHKMALFSILLHAKFNE